MDIIRKKFLVATLSVFVPIMVFVAFFASGAMEKLIEVAGSRAVGAQVSLGGANLALTLTSANLSNLQVTDPDEPMKNAFEADSIKFSLDGGNLLRRKVIINELSANGIRLETDRKKSGALGKKKKTKKAKKDKESKKSESLSIDSILKKEELAIEKSINKVSSGIDSDKKRLENKVANLPGDKEFSEYKKRADKIKNTKRDPFKMLSAAGDLKKLNKEVKGDIKEIKGLSSEVKNTVKKHKNAIKNLKEKELKRLMAKYSPSGMVSNITKSMFSPAVSGYVDKALMWSSKFKTDGGAKGSKKTAKPIRAKGTDVKFKEKNPLPDFLIKNAGLSVSIPQGDIAGSVIDITTDQETYGRPIKFEFTGVKLKGIKSLSVSGVINRVNPKKPKDNIDLSITGYELDGIALGDFILKGKADIISDTVIKGGGFVSNIKIVFTNTKFSSSKKLEGATNKALLKGLKGVNNFTVSAKVSGTPDDYKIKIKSGLDKVAKKVLSGAASEKAKEFEAQLREGLQKQMSSKLDGLTNQVGGLGSLDKILKNKSNLAGGLLR